MRQAFRAFAVAASFQKTCKKVFKRGIASLPCLQLLGSKSMLYFGKPLCQRSCRWVDGQPLQLPSDLDQLLMKRRPTESWRSGRHFMQPALNDRVDQSGFSVKVGV